MVYQVSQVARNEFAERGFTILDGVIDDTWLTALREECAYFIGYIDSYMDAKGLDVQGITHRGKRYFISGRYRKSNRLAGFLFGDLMAQVTRAFLGDSVYLFHEQWVVKGAEQGMKFAWHQDSGYVNFRDPGNTHKPYLTCWCALDDLSAENGTISVMPHDSQNTRARVLEHQQEAGTNDLIGYEGGESGDLLDMPAGSIAAFSSTSLHRSGENSTSHTRRVYLAQYSSERIVSTGGELWSQGVPFVANGNNIYSKEEDFAND